VVRRLSLSRSVLAYDSFRPTGAHCTRPMSRPPRQVSSSWPSAMRRTSSHDSSDDAPGGRRRSPSATCAPSGETAMDWMAGQPRMSSMLTARIGSVVAWTAGAIAAGAAHAAPTLHSVVRCGSMTVLTRSRWRPGVSLAVAATLPVSSSDGLLPDAMGSPSSQKRRGCVPVTLISISTQRETLMYAASHATAGETADGVGLSKITRPFVSAATPCQARGAPPGLTTARPATGSAGSRSKSGAWSRSSGLTPPTASSWNTGSGAAAGPSSSQRSMAI